VQILTGCSETFFAYLNLSEGLTVTAYDEDVDAKGNRDDLLAHGRVEPAPAWFHCNGSSSPMKTLMPSSSRTRPAISSPLIIKGSNGPVDRALGAKLHE
jgi:hypothetical protein